MGKKKILFGSFFVLLLILLMPSIPAVQQKTIEEKIISDFIEKFEDLDLQDINSLGAVKFPKLYSLITMIIFCRSYRCYLLFMISINFDPWSDELIYPLLFLRAYWLSVTTEFMIEKLERLSQIFGWGWFDEYKNPDS